MTSPSPSPRRSSSFPPPPPPFVLYVIGSFSSGKSSLVNILNQFFKEKIKKTQQNYLKNPHPNGRNPFIGLPIGNVNLSNITNTTPNPTIGVDCHTFHVMNENVHLSVPMSNNGVTPFPFPFPFSFPLSIFDFSGNQSFDSLRTEFFAPMDSLSPSLSPPIDFIFCVLDFSDFEFSLQELKSQISVFLWDKKEFSKTKIVFIANKIDKNQLNSKEILSLINSQSMKILIDSVPKEMLILKQSDNDNNREIYFPYLFALSSLTIHSENSIGHGIHPVESEFSNKYFGDFPLLCHILQVFIEKKYEIFEDKYYENQIQKSQRDKEGEEEKKFREKNKATQSPSPSPSASSPPSSSSSSSSPFPIVPLDSKDFPILSEERKEFLMKEIHKWSQLEFFSLLSDILSITISLSPPPSLSSVSSFYRRALRVIHPDKISPNDVEKHFLGTEKFKILHQKFTKYKDNENTKEKEKEIQKEKGKGKGNVS